MFKLLKYFNEISLKNYYVKIHTIQYFVEFLPILKYLKSNCYTSQKALNSRK